MKDKQLEFIVDKSNYVSYLRTYYTIHDHISKNEDVPAITVKYLLSLLLTKNDFDFRSWNQKTKLNIHYAEEFIKNHPDYQLNWELKGKPKVKEENYDFSVFARILLHAYYQQKSAMKDNFDKNDAIRFFFKIFSKEVEPTRELTTKKKLTTYKIAVMSGVFTIAAGHRITTKKHPTPKDIYLAVQYAIKKK